MKSQYVNLFECCNCEYWEELPADEPRNHMSAMLLEYGEHEEQYALYACPQCNRQSWSMVIPKD
jgi:hypothetical protein